MRGVYSQELIDSVSELYTRGHTQKEVAEQLGLTQKVIWRLMKKHGIKARVAAKRNQKGPMNSSWKGGKTVSSRGYILVLAPKHPRANSGYVFEHILVVEQSIGRLLVWKGPGHPDSEIVHHRDGDKTNNSIDNLEVHTFASHLDHHRDPLTGTNGGL